MLNIRIPTCTYIVLCDNLRLC